MKKYNTSQNVKEILSYSEDVHLAVIKAFLIDSKSHRQIQREILNLPAPAHGGGFVTMNILHYYGISGEDKGLLKKKSFQEMLSGAPGNLKQILVKIQECTDYEKHVKQQIQRKEFEFDNKKTEISVTTKARINQDILRQIVLENYNQECALCDIKSRDLLVCSHIIPWGIDHKNRLNPKNSICFCVLHDKLFDKGYFFFNDNYDIIISKKADTYIWSILNSVKFKKPHKDAPESQFLRFRRREMS